MSTQPQQLIQKLLKAEADAEGIIAKARESKFHPFRILSFQTVSRD